MAMIVADKSRLRRSSTVRAACCDRHARFAAARGSRTRWGPPGSLASVEGGRSPEAYRRSRSAGVGMEVDALRGLDEWARGLRRWRWSRCRGGSGLADLGLWLPDGCLGSAGLVGEG